ncbi:flippase [Burkholderia sp. Bp9143]|uniref:oligosaccharide flippase family protein n=1 Tax=Burkholderia sp. Bp9143 TaxID=2184574 RepID=UPI000F5900CC|nr:oligosaccharide flippase family protein [Burkholderia sp. Bp9143]RQR37533.1 flippase [Burkholderia sp. Bp9143]
MTAHMSNATRAMTSPGPRSGGARLGRNLAAMLLWQVGMYVVPLATFPYLTRVLGPVQFGVVGYVTALTMYGTILTEWGFNLSGPRAVAQCGGDSRRLSELVWSIVGAKACLCLVSCAILTVVLMTDRSLAAMSTTICIGWLGVVANVGTLNWLLQGLERFPAFTAVALASRFAALPLTFWLVRSPAHVDMAIAIQSLTAMLAAGGSMLMAHRLGLLGNRQLSWRAIRAQLIAGADMFVSTASVSLFSAANAVIVGAIAGPYQVGLYAAADKLKTAGNMVPAQINTVLYSRISALFADRQPESARAAARLTVSGGIAIVLVTGLGIAVCLSMSDMLTRIVLGRQFAGASSVVNVLCVSTLFGNLAYFLGLQVLVPFGGARRRARVMLAAGVLNILLALLLVPRWGAAGAATAYLIAEIALLAAFAFWIVCSATLRQHFAPRRREGVS